MKLCSLLLSLILPFHIFPAFAESPSTSSVLSPLRIAVVTDLHYIAPELTDHGAYFTSVVNSGDGKVSQYCEELCNALISHLLEKKPDAVLITGDLTFNGAVESHVALAQRLEVLLDAGIPVYVIPGNHDVYNHNAARFEGEHFERIPSASSSQFEEIWKSFGYTQALSRDTASLSYTVDLSSKVRLLMIDTNTEGHIGDLLDETCAWAEQQLLSAQQDGMQVIAASHQTLLPHNSMFVSGFQMNSADQLRDLYMKYGVILNLSGHMHLQHIANSADYLPEIVTSSASVAPCQYGYLTLMGNELEYHTERIPISDWARSQESSDENLLDFDRYALSFFTASTIRQAASALQNFDDELRSTLLTYMAGLNAAYFSGDLRSYSANDSSFRILSSLSGFWPLYLSSIIPDLGHNYTSFHYKFGGSKP